MVVAEDELFRRQAEAVRVVSDHGFPVAFDGHRTESGLTVGFFESPNPVLRVLDLCSSEKGKVYSSQGVAIRDFHSEVVQDLVDTNRATGGGIDDQSGEVDVDARQICIVVWHLAGAEHPHRLPGPARQRKASGERRTTSADHWQFCAGVAPHTLRLRGQLATRRPTSARKMSPSQPGGVNVPLPVAAASPSTSSAWF